LELLGAKADKSGIRYVVRGDFQRPGLEDGVEKPGNARVRLSWIRRRGTADSMARVVAFHERALEEIEPGKRKRPTEPDSEARAGLGAKLARAEGELASARATLEKAEAERDEALAKLAAIQELPGDLTATLRTWRDRSKELSENLNAVALELGEKAASATEAVAKIDGLVDDLKGILQDPKSFGYAISADDMLAAYAQALPPNGCWDENAFELPPATLSDNETF
jgi:hypothetical protein